MFESSAAKANNVLQDMRLNEQLEPLEMANGGCAGTAARPIAIYMYPVLEQFVGRGEQLSLDVESHRRVLKQSKVRKEPSDMQQEGEDDETHDQRLKFLKSQRVSEAKIEQHASDVPVGHKRSKEAAAKPKQVRSTMPMELFDARKNKMLGKWSATPSPSEHRAIVESKYLIDAIQKQLGRDDASLRLNELTGPYAFHTVLTKLNKAGSGLSGFPAYTNGKHAAALHQAVKDRWLCKPTAHNSSSASA